MIYDAAAAAAAATAAARSHVALAVLDQILGLFARDPSLRHVAHASLTAATEIQQIQQRMIQKLEGPDVASSALDVDHVQAGQVFNLGQLDIKLHLFSIVNALFAVNDVRGGGGGCCLGANIVAAIAVAAAIEEELEWNRCRVLSGASSRICFCGCVCIGGVDLVWHHSSRLSTTSRSDAFDLEIMALFHINPHMTEACFDFM